MKKTRLLKHLSLLLCAVLIAAMALVTSGCNDKKTDTVTLTLTDEATVLGEGATVFEFTVVDVDGKATAFEIHTDKETVGDALLELGLIAGDESQYGLYVKTVNGVTLEYDKDGKYWAFYENGQYAMTGVDTTNITVGAVYMFKAE